MTILVTSSRLLQNPWQRQGRLLWTHQVRRVCYAWEGMETRTRCHWTQYPIRKQREMEAAAQSILTISLNLEPQPRKHCSHRSTFRMSLPSKLTLWKCSQEECLSAAKDSRGALPALVWPLWTDHTYSSVLAPSADRIHSSCNELSFWPTPQFLGFVLNQTFRTNIITRFAVWHSECRLSLGPFTSVFIQPDFFRNK